MRFDDDPLDVLISGKAKLWMLLVGVNQYQDERLTPLNFAVSDCQGLAEALEEATQSFPNSEVIIHCNSAAPPATLEAIRTSLRRIVDEANSQDTVLFYFSGHGMVEPASKQPFLCLAQTQTDNLHNTGLGLQELLQQLKLCGASKQLVLLDACHSGSIVLLSGGARGEAVETQPNPTRELAEVLHQCAAQSRGFCALLSCDEGQQSWEFPDLEHGVFTYYLMQGLWGEAADARGVIEAKGLYDYVYDRTQRYVDSRIRQLRLPNPHNYQQTPILIISMAGDLVLGLRPEAVDLLKDYENRLLEYTRNFNRAIQQEYPLSQDTRQQLQRLQQLGLRDEDIISTEARIIAVYEPKLKRYEQEITALIHQQYPLNQDTRQQLQQLQQELGLSNKIVAEISARVAEAYAQKQYPLSDRDRVSLSNFRRFLNLSEEITTTIEQQVTQGYEQKLQQYSEAFTRSIQRQYPLSDDEHDSLKSFRGVLNLSEEITTTIEKQITQGYEQKLQQYSEAFTKAIQRQYPLSDDEYEVLSNLRRVLNLSETITTTIENQITQGYEQKLQQYQEAFTSAIQRQYPLSDDEREILSNFRRVLNLSEKITDEIEAEVTETYNLQPRLPTADPQGGGDKKKVQRLLLKATVVAAAFVSVSLAGYAYIQWQAYQYAAALESTKILKQGKNYEKCVNQAKAVPQKSRFYADAQNLLNECQRLAQDEKWLAQAKELAKNNNFKDAIASASKIQSDSSFYQEAQQLISQWSEKPDRTTPSEAMPDEDNDYLW